jgi:hypothetical protein
MKQKTLYEILFVSSGVGTIVNTVNAIINKIVDHNIAQNYINYLNSLKTPIEKSSLAQYSIETVKYLSKSLQVVSDIQFSTSILLGIISLHFYNQYKKQDLSDYYKNISLEDLTSEEPLTLDIDDL